MLGAASGAVAGLVAIGVICYTAVMMKSRFGYDDSLDVVGVHGVGGIFGALATGVFATKLINPAGNDGGLYGKLKSEIRNLKLDVGAQSNLRFRISDLRFTSSNFKINRPAWLQSHSCNPRLE